MLVCLSKMYAAVGFIISSLQRGPWLGKAPLGAAWLPDSILGGRCCHNRFTQQSQICTQRPSTSPWAQSLSADQKPSAEKKRLMNRLFMCVFKDTITAICHWRRCSSGYYTCVWQDEKQGYITSGCLYQANVTEMTTLSFCKTERTQRQWREVVSFEVIKHLRLKPAPFL